jgi:hypothetical protein
MKELEHYEKVNEEIQVVKPIKKELKLLGTIKPQKGHKCFEYNLKTNEVSEATYTESEITILSSSMFAPKRKINVKEDCIYITALNKENAWKKINKLG